MISLVKTMCHMASVIASQVANAVQSACYQVTFQTAGQAESSSGLGEFNKHLLHNIFRGVNITRQDYSKLEQMTMILIIDPPQGFATSPLKFPDKQLIFHYPITHQAAVFLYMVYKFFEKSLMTI